MNGYSYCYNNPLIYSEPSGHEALTLSALAIVIIVTGGYTTYRYLTSHEVRQAAEDLASQFTEDIKTNYKVVKNWYINKVDAKNSGETKVDDKSKGHIFRNEEGHLTEDTPENRQQLEDVANDEDNYLGKDKYGNDWYAETNSDRTQTWVEVRSGKITNGG